MKCFKIHVVHVSCPDFFFRPKSMNLSMLDESFHATRGSVIIPKKDRHRMTPYRTRNHSGHGELHSKSCELVQQKLRVRTCHASFVGFVRSSVSNRRLFTISSSCKDHVPCEILRPRLLLDAMQLGAKDRKTPFRRNLSSICTSCAGLSCQNYRQRGQ